jgi:L-ascorbate metabolism protein UlaG (beta-lactamase superfamily)
MQITYLGHSCFKIQAKTNNGEVVVVTDPFDKEIGLRMPKTTADIVTVSHDHHDHNKVKEVSGESFVVDSPGEYEIKGVFVYGIPSFHDKQKGKERGENIIFVIKLLEEDISIAHLGDLGHVLDNDELEYLEKIDVLMIPVGGKYTIGSKDAMEVINQIDPRIVIPMHYKTMGLKIDGLDGVDVFSKEVGMKVENTGKLKILKKDLQQEETKVVILDR